jgi:DNA modification methylase
MTYDEFIAKKMVETKKSGFEVKDLNEKLFPFQAWIVERAIKAGKYAVFADCGLGKTFMQLEWARKVADHTSGEVLILAPLAVTDQTVQEAEHFGISLDRITVTNYEQIDNIDCSIYSGVVLDESSILKNFQGATKEKIVASFKNTTYKLACTATPSPNDPVELGNHSEFLDVMPRTEMLAMYFVNDAGDTGEWLIKGHAVKHFYQWVSTWAVMLNNPSDIGFPMAGYDLPPLELIDHQIITPSKGIDLFNAESVSATDFNAELRRTMNERLEKAADIANNTEGQIIVWIKQNDEGERLRKMIPGSVEVSGSDDPEIKKKNLLGFAKNEFRVLLTKAKIAQFGLNYQNCHCQIFASLDFSFEGVYQAMRRSYRFGQKHPVKIHMITTDTMGNVSQAIKTKQDNFIMMQNEMADAINANLEHRMVSSEQYDTDDVITEHYHIRRGDCVRLIKDLPDESVGFSVFSPPFADLFVYSSHVEDMGNCKDDEQFEIQFGFLAKELFRVIKSGRNVAVHCMDLPAQKGRHGHIGIRDFTGLILRLFESVGFIYASRITIWKDPVVAMQRTKALGLLHKQIKKDATMSRVGIPDTILVFRKDGERNDPVSHYGSYNEMINEVNSKGLIKEIEETRILDVETWQKYASPIWMDIEQGNTLNGRAAREEEDEKHMCPLQLPVIQRLVHLYTNPGDTVLTPFLGIGSELYQSVKMGRKGIGFELKESYYHQAKQNLENVLKEKSQGELF